MFCGYFRKDIPSELLGICTLVHANKNFSDEGSFYFCGSGWIFTSNIEKYVDTTTVKAITKFYMTTLPADMIFTKEDVSTSD